MSSTLIPSAIEAFARGHAGRTPLSSPSPYSRRLAPPGASFQQPDDLVLGNAKRHPVDGGEVGIFSGQFFGDNHVRIQYRLFLGSMYPRFSSFTAGTNRTRHPRRGGVPSCQSTIDTTGSRRPGCGSRRTQSSMSSAAVPGADVGALV